ncbi:hypothetical protein P5V15_010243 [Pogonomyrmex californicus]
MAECRIEWKRSNLPGTMIRKSGSAIITNGRSGVNTIGHNGNRISVANRSQLEPSPHELPVKDTDHAIDVAHVEYHALAEIINSDYAESSVGFL